MSSKFIDGFGLLVNGINIAFVDGKPVNVNHPSMAVKPGTQLDGVLAPGGVPVVSFSATVGANTTGNTLTFIIADRADRILDSTAYISPLSIGRSTLLLGGADAAVPEPASVVLLGSVMAVLAYSCRNRLRGLRF